MYTFRIGGVLLTTDNEESSIGFYGSIDLNNGRWRVNFIRQRFRLSSGYYGYSSETVFNLDISKNDTIRFAQYYGLFISKKKEEDTVQIEVVLNFNQ